MRSTHMVRDTEIRNDSPTSASIFRSQMSFKVQMVVFTRMQDAANAPRFCRKIDGGREEVYAAIVAAHTVIVVKMC